MDTLTLMIMVALVGGALALIFYPLWQQTRPKAIFEVNRAGTTLEEYEARYQATLDAIKDLMFDYELGKVSTEDYELLLHKTKLEAATLRRHIDQLSRGAATEIDVSLGAEIEALVAQFKTGSLNGHEQLLREVDAEIALLKALDLGEPGLSGDSPTLTCPHCGRTVEADDIFCSRCGQPLPEPAPEIDEDICPNCGYTYQPDDLFCAKCGAALEAATRQEPEDAAATEFPA
jgi:predicted nucleic acid-binding Zn ribbon protein